MVELWKKGKIKPLSGNREKQKPFHVESWQLGWTLEAVWAHVIRSAYLGSTWHLEISKQKCHHFLLSIGWHSTVKRILSKPEFGRATRVHLPGIPLILGQAKLPPTQLLYLLVFQQHEFLCRIADSCVMRLLINRAWAIDKLTKYWRQAIKTSEAVLGRAIACVVSWRNGERTGSGTIFALQQQQQNISPNALKIFFRRKKPINKFYTKLHQVSLNTPWWGDFNY